MKELPYTGKYVVGVILIALAAVAGLYVNAGWSNQDGRAVLIVVAAVAAVVFAFGGFFLKAGWDDHNDQPDIELRRTAFFWIEIEKNIYQIGVVIRLFNLGGKPYLVRGVALNATKPLSYGRGVAHIQRVILTGVLAEITDDNFLKPMDGAYFKMLLPIKFEATIEHPPPPGISFVGTWALILRKGEHPVQPKFFGTFDRTISPDEWASLLKTSSTISIDDISFDKPAPIVPREAPVGDFLLFNPDRSATFHVFGFDQTPYARANAGTMVYVRGKGIPPLDGGWVVLGNSYEDVWADAQKRALYDTIFPPAPDGSPRPIAVFQ